MKLFHKAIKKLNIVKEDQCYFLGDVIDYGNYGIEILDIIMTNDNYNLCLGDHEILLLQSLIAKNLESLDFWRQNGGEVTYQLIKKLNEKQKHRLFNFLENCPLVFTNEGEKGFFLSHAGLLVNENEGGSQKKLEDILRQQEESNLYLIKEDFYMRPALSDRLTVFAHATTTEIIGYKSDKIWYDKINKDKICINCDIVNNNVLGILELNEKDLFNFHYIT